MQARSKERPADEGPLLGALLRVCHQLVVARLDRGFREANLPPLQTAATQPLWDEPGGLRVTDLARRAGITKQSMGEMVDAMEDARYLERVPDPSDARARLVRLSARGRAAGRLARKLVREVEDEWAEAVGATRVAALRETLRLIAASKISRPAWQAVRESGGARRATRRRRAAPPQPASP